MRKRPKGGWALLGGILGLLSGTLPDAIEPQHETSESEATASTGFSIEGDGFYVWYEDRREAEEWAIELAGPAFPRRDS